MPARRLPTLPILAIAAIALAAVLAPGPALGRAARPSRPSARPSRESSDPPKAAPDPGRFAGRVLLSNGAPATSATVRLVRAGEPLWSMERPTAEVTAETTPSLDGRFELHTETSEPVCLVASCKGWATTRDADYRAEMTGLTRQLLIAHLANQLPEELEQMLEQELVLNEARTVRGKVTDKQGQPIANARVYASSGYLAEEQPGYANDMSATYANTGPDGTFVLDDV